MLKVPRAFRSRRGFSPSRVVGLALLALIAFDLTDTSCDPLVIPVAAAMRGGSSDLQNDPCGGVCVPDCFCCSTTLAALPAFSLPESAMIAADVTPVFYRVALGVSSVVEHVPKA
jgi:hypothetical protein